MIMRKPKILRPHFMPIMPAHHAWCGSPDHDHVLDDHDRRNLSVPMTDVGL